jgi:myo-inositol-1(or 4)-monophosphatase
MAESD